jgi:hypothetical protein
LWLLNHRLQSLAGYISPPEDNNGEQAKRSSQKQNSNAIDDPESVQVPVMHA